MFEDISRVRLVVLAGGVVVLTLLASFGFAAVTQNPLVPAGTTVDIHDAPGEFRFNESGRSDIVVIEHTGGEAVPLAELEIRLGSPSSGFVLNATGNWTLDAGAVRYAARYESATSTGPDDPRFGPGDTLTLAKVSGSVDAPVDAFDVRVTLRHRPSQTAIAVRTVEVS